LIEDRAVVFRIGKEERRLVLGDSLQELRPRAKKPDDASRRPAKAAEAKPAGS
jgi:hypothetical protein